MPASRSSSTRSSGSAEVAGATAGGTAGRAAERTTRRHAIVLADGGAAPRSLLDAAWPGWDAGVAIVIAADGGARHATAFGLRIDRWVGDGDSIEPAMLDALAAAGVAVDRVAAEKDESDAELALLAALAAGADAVTIIGALGGPRVDHA